MLCGVSSLALLAGFISVFASSCPTDTLWNHYDGQVPGASVIVIKDGAAVFERSWGIANLDTGEKTSSDTNYRLASISKTFTAMSVLMLAEKGTLSLDHKVTRYLPELATVAPKVTLRHLLTHTHGLPEYEPLLDKEGTQQILDRDVLELVAKQPVPAIAPGTKYVYSNTGYALLALVVERASKLKYAEFLKRNIFKPLGMTTSLAYDVNATIAHRALGYTGVDKFRNNDQNRTSAVLGDGGIYSSARDLVRWIDALEKNTLVDAKLLAEATTAHVSSDDPGYGYGYGWKVTEHNGEKLVFHTGLTSGFRNALLWVPSRKLAVIVLTNRRYGYSLLLGRIALEQFWTTAPATP